MTGDDPHAALRRRMRQAERWASLFCLFAAVVCALLAGWIATHWTQP